ncbi:MAG TPA: hypothetical protein VFD70_23265 [Anaerolineae bacterium]|nr:hypothetical protein [Anaerolineae bacterium]
MSLPKSFDIQFLKRQKQISFYFRYPLYHSEFREVRENSRLRGYYTAKPLYGKLTHEGKVDRSAGYNGQIAVLFIPSPARSGARAELILTRIPKKQVTLENGKRNWRAIRQAAEQAILTYLKKHK